MKNKFYETISNKWRELYFPTRIVFSDIIITCNTFQTRLISAGTQC